MTTKYTKDVDPAELEKLLLRVSNQLESTEDIFSPRAQREFRSYKGTFKEYMRERDLRKKAGGRKRTFFNIAAALTGDENISRIISEKFDEKYSQAEVEEAKQALRDEFGIKEPDEKKEEPKNEELFERYFQPITESIKGIMKVVDQTAEDIKKSQTSISSIANMLVPTINNLAGVLAGKNESGKSVAERLKPMTIPDEEGKEYLYYPDAPEGRQLYEKGKSGTAGRIASKKVQRSLKGAISNMMRESSNAAVKRSSMIEGPQDEVILEILSGVKKLLNEETAYRKTEMERLMADLKVALKPKGEENLVNLEPDDQKKELKSIVKKALKEFVDENPDAFNEEGGGGILGNILGALGLTAGLKKLGGGLGKIATKLGLKKGVEALGKEIVEEAGEKAAVKVAEKTALKTIVKKVPLVGAIAGLLFGTNRAMQGDWTGAAMEVGSGLAGSVPMVGTGIGLGLDAALIARDLGMGAALVTEKKSEPTGQQIIDQNRRKIEINRADEVTIPTQTVNQFSTTSVIPVPAKDKSISVNNPDNTFNRLLAQEFNHPSTYSSLTMG